LNGHGISIQGILWLESRKSQQRLNLFDLGFFCLDQNRIIERLVLVANIHMRDSMQPDLNQEFVCEPS
jgi:hypothetical protein